MRCCWCYVWRLACCEHGLLHLLVGLLLCGYGLLIHKHNTFSDGAGLGLTEFIDIGMNETALNI